MPRAASLEKEVAGLREKIHHLDDMLKSQQRKVRQMIEQVNRARVTTRHLLGKSPHGAQPCFPVKSMLLLFTLLGSLAYIPYIKTFMATNY